MPFVRQTMTRSADGNVVAVPAHRAVIEWDGAIRIAHSSESSGIALLGMELLRDFDLRARCQVGGMIEIAKVP